MQSSERQHAVVQLAPDNAEAWTRLGSCRFQLEQFNAAISPLRRAAQLLTPAGPSLGAVHLQDTLWLLMQVGHTSLSLVLCRFTSNREDCNVWQGSGASSDSV